MRLIKIILFSLFFFRCSVDYQFVHLPNTDPDKVIPSIKKGKLIVVSDEYSEVYIYRIKNWKRNGQTLSIHNDGGGYNLVDYRMDSLDGQYTFYDKNGEIRLQIDYKMGKRIRTYRAGVKF